ncbi:MAG TPA: AAA family ATPase [Polyangiaceae bacterium]|jgi:predicted ATPase
MSAAPRDADAIASFVPRLVAGGSRPREAAVLFVDAVSFTSRVAPLVDAGPRGIEQVSALLDAQYAPQLRVVAEHGGEVIRFVGDALLAVVPAEGRTLAEATRTAEACGRAIQAAARPAMPDGAPLAVRVVVTAGTVAALRDAHGEHFVLAGSPVAALAAWAPKAGPGEVLVAPALAPPPAPTPTPTPARPPTPDDLRRFVPRPVLDRIDSGHLDWLAELRRTTAVFVSLRGLADADVPDVLAQCGALAAKHEAFFKELVLDDKGWTLVALTGVPPFAGSDDASRAAAFARDVVLALDARGLRAAAGVASGRVVCGTVGSIHRREYAVTGVAMNLASRLSQVAAAGQVLCDEQTARVARGRVALEAQPPVVVKGFAAPVAVSSVGSDVAAAARAAGDLVGRAADRAALAGGVEEARAGHAPAATVLEGEPGIGKSRLCADLVVRAEGQGLLACAGAAQSVDRASPYHAWRGVFAAVLAVLGATDAASLAATAGEADAPYVPLLEPLVSLGMTDGSATAPLVGQVRAKRTRDLCVALLRRAAARRPLLLLLEDLHWGDAASWDLVRDVVGAAVPGLFLVGTSRAEGFDELAAFERAGGVRRAITGLPREATAALLASSFGVNEVDAAVLDRVHGRSAGNPLFAEQLARSLVESRAVTREGGRCAFAPGVNLATVELPATVEGAITARLDRLSSATQLAIKVASVVGATFERAMLEHVYPSADGARSVDAHLAALIEAQLLAPAAGATYRFRHELVRDVAYGMLLFEQRRVLHGQVAARIEAQHGADLDPYLVVLAYHHRNAGNAERAAGYLERASVRAFRIGLARQSVELGMEGAELLGVTLPRDPAAVGARIGELVGATMGRIAGRVPTAMLDLPDMKDPVALRTIGVLLELAPFTFQAGRPDLYALLGLTMLDLVLSHGNAAPDVYSTYSVIHRAVHEDPRGAHAWSELALALDARQGGAARARVAFVHDWFHAHWLRPLRESVARSLEAAEAGLATGDVLFGCYNLSGHVVYAAAAGRPLGEVAELAATMRERNGGRVVNAAFHCVHEMQVAKAIAGRTRAPLSLSDDAVDEERDVASITATDFYNQIGYYLVSRVKLHALFGDAAGALGWAARIGPLHGAIAGQVAEIDLVLFRTLAEIDEGLVDQARAGAALVTRWAELCPANFAHLAALLDGALRARDGDREGALSTFAAAASLAEAEGFVQHAAVAYERAARVDASLLTNAVDAYARWGAEAKVRALRGG